MMGRGGFFAAGGGALLTLPRAAARRTPAGNRGDVHLSCVEIAVVVTAGDHDTVHSCMEGRVIVIRVDTINNINMYQ